MIKYKNERWEINTTVMMNIGILSFVRQTNDHYKRDNDSFTLFLYFDHVLSIQLYLISSSTTSSASSFISTICCHRRRRL
jgi:hypothetical protein